MKTCSGAPMREAVATLTAAFSDGALFRKAFPDAARRRRALDSLFTAVLEDAARHGRIDVARSDRIVGLLVWYPPGCFPMTVARVMRRLPSFLRVACVSPFGVFKLYRAQAALEKLRPNAPHCHGYFLGGVQGAKIGVALARRVLDEADAEGWPIYLETQERRAVTLYARLGFTTLHDAVEIFPGAPPTWIMWREPQAVRERVSA